MSTTRPRGAQRSDSRRSVGTHMSAAALRQKQQQQMMQQNGGGGGGTTPRASRGSNGSITPRGAPSRASRQSLGALPSRDGVTPRRGSVGSFTPRGSTPRSINNNPITPRGAAQRNSRKSVGALPTREGVTPRSDRGIITPRSAAAKSAGVVGTSQRPTPRSQRTPRGSNTPSSSRRSAGSLLAAMQQQQNQLNQMNDARRTPSLSRRSDGAGATRMALLNNPTLPAAMSQGKPYDPNAMASHSFSPMYGGHAPSETGSMGPQPTPSPVSTLSSFASTHSRASGLTTLPQMSHSMHYALTGPLQVRSVAARGHTHLCTARKTLACVRRVRRTPQPTLTPDEIPMTNRYNKDSEEYRLAARRVAREMHRGRRSVGSLLDMGKSVQGGGSGRGGDASEEGRGGGGFKREKTMGGAIGRSHNSTSAAPSPPPSDDVHQKSFSLPSKPRRASDQNDGDTLVSERVMVQPSSSESQGNLKLSMLKGFNKQHKDSKNAENFTLDSVRSVDTSVAYRDVNPYMQAV